MILPAFDPLYLLFMIPPFLLGLLASLLLRLWTSQYQKETLRTGLSGLEIISRIAEAEAFRVKVNLIPDLLGESWDPVNRILNISQDNAHGRNITAAGIITHELGHVEQQQDGSALFKLRTAIVPAVNIGTNLGYFLIIIGLILQFSSMAWLGIIFFSLATIFALITVPLELDASRRALALLNRHNIIYRSEAGGVKKVLAAAALTYVAALFQSLGQLAYFIFRVQGFSRSED